MSLLPADRTTYDEIRINGIHSTLQGFRTPQNTLNFDNDDSLVLFVAACRDGAFSTKCTKWTVHAA